MNPLGYGNVNDQLVPRNAADAKPSAARRKLTGLTVTFLVAGLALLGIAGYGIVASISASERAAAQASSDRAAVDEAAAEAAVRDSIAPTEAPAELRGVSALIAPSWVAETSASLGIPARALAAYAGAAMQLQREQPGCGIDWTTLAGIGLVESAHGTIHGGAIEADGQQRPAITGIALDGSTTNAIPDTDGGALDGDAAWDRAVGPMQIIPETWRQYAVDGNDDGVVDPQQIDDAALTAASYLCAVGVDLTDPEGWIAAVSAYNDTADYNHRVADATTAYRTA